ncbi:DUF4113 domain-containing protein [Pseudomonas fluorescens]|nr:hypothetical protein [Pseudomonas aeruginosa]HBN9886130.1 hypothetical protein [Pseudomonas aeruginosa]
MHREMMSQSYTTSLGQLLRVMA